MRVQAIPLNGLVYDPKNPRLHNDRNLGAIQASLTRHGQVEPLLVQRTTQMVIAGNGRLQAMNSMGWEHAQCVLLDVDDKQARELSIALNRSGELASWDEAVLAEHLTALASLTDNDNDLEALGFTGDEMQGLLDSFDEAIDELDAANEDSAPDTSSLEEETLPAGTQPVDMPSAKMREIKVFLDPDDYDGFQMAIRFLSGVYGTDNISDTICYAVKASQESEQQVAKSEEVSF
jgi:ParB-like chromosome segregation protein Spo0J